MKLLEKLLAVAGIAALLALTNLLWRASLTVETVDRAVQERSNQVATVLTHADDTVLKLEGVAANANVLVSEQRHHIATLERATLLDQKKALEILIAVKQAIGETNENVNGKAGVLPELASTIRRAGDDADQLTIAAVPVIEHTDDLVNSAAVKETLSSVAATSGYTRDSVKEVRDAIHEMRNPPKKTRGRRIADFILQYVISNAIKGVASK